MNKVILKTLIFLITIISHFTQAQTWSAVGVSVDVVNAMAVNNGQLYVSDVYSLYQYNDTVWSIISNSGGFASLASFEGYLYAGGDFFSITYSDKNNNLITTIDSCVAKWDGNNWYAVPGIPNNGNPINDFSVNCFLPDNSYNSLITAIEEKNTLNGYWTIGDGQTFNNYTSFTDPSYTNVIHCFSSYNGYYYLGCDNGIYIFNWGTWTRISGGPMGPVYSLTVLNNELYAGGDFTSVNDSSNVISTNYIAKWDGSHWYALGPGLGGSDYYSVGVSAVTSNNGELYAAGCFTTAGTDTVNHIARWDGSSWWPLGSGTNGDIYYNSLIVFNGDLYVGGSFNKAGGIPVVNIAKWHDCSSPITAGSTSICLGDSTILTANKGDTYQWSLNGAPISGATLVTYSAKDSGNYTCVIANDSCSSISNTVTLTVKALPIATVTAGGPTTFCSGNSVELSASTGRDYSYQWNNGSDIAGATSSTYSASASGIYTCFVSNSCGSSASNAIIITADTLPSALMTAAGPTTFCSGDSVVLNANTGIGLSYQWNNGTNITGATASSYTATASDNYTCIVTNSNNCSAISNNITVVVNPLPVCVISQQNQEFCQGGSDTLCACPGINFAWSNGATSQCIIITDSGVYSIVITDINGCTASNFYTVQINSLPTAVISISGPTDICAGASVTLNADTGSGLSYQWSNGTNIAGATASAYAATDSGTYNCLVTNSNNCNAMSNDITITMNPSPTSSFTIYPDTTILHHYYIVNNSTGISPLSYYWSWGDGSYDTTAYPTHTYADSGFYTICLTVTDSNGCTNVQCDSSYHVMRTTDYMIYVNVINPLILGTKDTESNSQDIRIYPNPFNSQATISFSEEQRNTTIRISDMLGNEIKTIVFTGKLLTIEKGVLHSGIYFLQVSDEAKNAVNKRIRVIQ